MKTKEALQEFIDNAFHNSMKPDISESAKDVSTIALCEKIFRENPNPLSYNRLKDFVHRPVFIVDGNVRCWTILVSINDDFAHFVESEDCGIRLMMEGCGITWFPYEFEPKEVNNGPQKVV